MEGWKGGRGKEERMGRDEGEGRMGEGWRR